MELTLVFTLGVLMLRFGVLVAGVLFCWFGYRLFAQTSAQGNADISVKDMIKINLQQVGPGVFFSLFGAAILVFSIYKPPVLTAQEVDWMQRVSGAQSAPSVQSNVTIAGARSGTKILDDRADLNQVREQIGFMNRLDASGKVHPDDQLDVARLVRETKLTLMRSVWSDAWGDQAQFVAWARNPALDAPNAEARIFYERH